MKLLTLTVLAALSLTAASQEYHIVTRDAGCAALTPPAPVVDEEGFTVQEPVESELCPGSEDRYRFIQNQYVATGPQCGTMQPTVIVGCDAVESSYEYDDPAEPEPVADPAKSCLEYDLENGCKE